MSFPIATIIEAVSAAAVVVSFIFASGRFAARVDENTRATIKLSALFEKFSDKVEARIDSHGDKLAEHETKLAQHEVRIDHLEKRVK